MRLEHLIGVCLLAVCGCGEHRSTARATGAIEHRVDGQVVAATLRLASAQAKPGEAVDLSVKLDVAPLWEIRTLDDEFAGAATKLALDLPAGVESPGEWQAPRPGRSVSGDGHAAYGGEVVFTRRLVVRNGTAGGDYPVRCRVSYQACDARQCLAPAEVELAATLRVE
jgi:hypothetical protein